MKRLKHAVFGIGMAVASCAIVIPSYAYYTAETGITANALSISHVYLIRFAANGGTGSMADSSIALGHGHTVPVNTMTKTGYTFTGWDTKPNGSGIHIADGGGVDVLPETATDTVLYAQWRPNKYTVTFNANGGSGTQMSNSNCTYDSPTGAPTNTYTKANHLFTGWNTKADGSGTAVKPGGIILNLTAQDNGNVTLYAQWEDESADIVETVWKKNLSKDADGNGTADRLELKAGESLAKDPSLKNHTSKDSYGYILVSVPTVGAKMSGDSAYKVYDVFTFTPESNWTLVKSNVSGTAGTRSKYLYRYNTVLKANGTSVRNANHELRYADRTTDLFSKLTVRNFTSADAVNSSVDVSGVLIEATSTAANADKMAVESLITAGKL